MLPQHNLSTQCVKSVRGYRLNLRLNFIMVCNVFIIVRTSIQLKT